MQQIERQLVAILAADIAGYSPDGCDEEGTLARLRTCRRGVGPAARHHGK
jgi:hypothetical protein